MSKEASTGIGTSIRISSFILIIVISLSICAVSLAWLVSESHIGGDHDFTAETIAGYFAGGDGSEADPYRITQPVHLYNLAWLQQITDMFSQETHFELVNDIDMAGMLGGAEGNPTGAIPPIGSSEKPFIGHFDGNNCTISNLWVSTDSDDWAEKPQNMIAYESTHVGLFGAIAEGAIIENFVLDRVEITCHIDATVGIICGYVDAMVNDIGVYSSTITVAQGATCKSNYSILGEKSDNIEWIGAPVLSPEHGGPVGDLVVDPNGYVVEGSSFSSVLAGEAVQVYNSSPGTAYYAGALEASSASVSGQWKVFDLTNIVLNNQKNQKLPVFSTDSSSATAKKMMAEMFKSYKGGSTMIKVSTSFLGTGNEKYITKDSKGNAIDPIPEGLIWFKPQNSGTVSLAFGATNQSGDRYVALYKCIRENGKLTVVNEEIFTLPIDKQDWKNGSIAYYEYEIVPEDVGKYEYLIGLPSEDASSDNSFGFFALTLAGTSPDSGDVDIPTDGVYSDAIYSVDYVTSPNQIVEFDQGYEIHMTILHMNEFTAGSEYAFQYNAIGTSPDSIVHYYDPGGHIEDYSRDQESTLDNNAANYEDRDPYGTQA